MEVDIELPDIKDVVRDLQKLRVDVVPKAMHRAEALGLRKFNTATKKAIAKRYSVPQKVIARRVKPRRAIFGKAKEILFALSIPVGLKYFGARDKRPKGVTAKVSGKRLTLPSAFIAPGKNSRGEFVFQRKGKDRLPLERKGVDISVGSRVEAEKLEKQGLFGREMDREFGRQIRLLAAQAAFKYLKVPGEK